MPSRPAEQRAGRGAALLLDMHEGAGQLDQAFVKVIIRSTSLRQPEILQHFVRFEELLPVETFKKTQVMRVPGTVLQRLGLVGNPPALVAHSQAG